MNYNDMTMIELREMCAKHGIVAGRSKAETIKRIEARDAELQDFANRHGEALAKSGMAIRSGGKDYKPEDHQPCQGCETIKAEAALAEYRAAHPEIAAEGAKMCDCDPVGDAAREHYQGIGKQPCDCQPDDTVDAMAYATGAQPLPDDAGFTTEVGADGVRRVTGMHPALGAPYGAQPEVIGVDYGQIEARALAHDIEAAKRDTPPTTPAYGVLSRRMVTMIRNQPKASVPGSVRRRMQREAAR